MATSLKRTSRERKPPIPHSIHFLSDEKIILLIQDAHILYRVVLQEQNRAGTVRRKEDKRTVMTEQQPHCPISAHEAK
jgi:hypothetical protein